MIFVLQFRVVFLTRNALLLFIIVTAEIVFTPVGHFFLTMLI